MKKIICIEYKNLAYYYSQYSSHMWVKEKYLRSIKQNEHSLRLLSTSH